MAAASCRSAATPSANGVHAVFHVNDSVLVIYYYQRRGTGKGTVFLCSDEGRLPLFQFTDADDRGYAFHVTVVGDHDMRSRTWPLARPIGKPATITVGGPITHSATMPAAAPGRVARVAGRRFSRRAGSVTAPAQGETS
ncbi:MAG: hypothetical protein KatS3mg038_0763 [Candidatus Kapaibacterium sp.]|nr:MAG: hypothetical protein KatS3mg038_0763 [Candidatus Kapabacteria bacterium]